MVTPVERTNPLAPFRKYINAGSGLSGDPMRPTEAFYEVREKIDQLSVDELSALSRELRYTDEDIGDYIEKECIGERNGWRMFLAMHICDFDYFDSHMSN